jgi:type IV pilus assembly protein PilA
MHDHRQRRLSIERQLGRLTTPVDDARRKPAIGVVRERASGPALSFSRLLGIAGRERAADASEVEHEEGFTGIEVLTVMAILCLLFAIAVPAYFNQRDKARDAQAKANARGAQTAALEIGADNDGRYNGRQGVTVAGLEARDASLKPADLSVPLALADTFTVRVQSETGNTFDVTYSEQDGSSDLTCASPGDGGCPADGTWD